MDNDSVKTRLTVVGLGGIGSNLVELLVPALEKIGVAMEIYLMDGDIVAVSYTHLRAHET